MADMGALEVHLIPESEIKAWLGSTPGWREMGDRMWARSVETCPVGVDESGSAHGGTHLKDTMFRRFAFGADPHIDIGSGLTREGGISALGLIEEGTSAHEIVGRNSPKKVLRFVVGGAVVFAKRVHHPGTKANRFVEKACQLVAAQGGMR